VKQFAIYFLSVLILVACDSGEEILVDIGKEYLPLKVGAFQTYAVDQTIYTETDDPATSQYELLIEVIDSFPDAHGDFTYVLHRSTRPNTAEAWQYSDTWSVRVNDLEAIVNEENTSFVKISFPVREGKLWDGNKFNTVGEDQYEMLDVGKTFSAGNLVFDKTIFIDQQQQEDLLFSVKRVEVFAKGVGLIYKEIKDISYCDDFECFGQKEIKSGIIYKQTITGYGTN
jgi:hypothetical protein